MGLGIVLENVVNVLELSNKHIQTVTTHVRSIAGNVPDQ